MNEVNKTLFIPLYGKSQVSKKGIILNDPTAERIWEAESFPIHGKSKSKCLSYNMAMRARVFDDWTESMLRANKAALVLHIGCGLDSRCLRVKEPYANWIDGDFPEVLSLREKYYKQTDAYRMTALDASDAGQICSLPRQRNGNRYSGRRQHVPYKRAAEPSVSGIGEEVFRPSYPDGRVY